MVVAQVVEWLLLTPQILISNPVVGKYYFLTSLSKRRKIKMRPGMTLFKKIDLLDGI